MQEGKVSLAKSVLTSQPVYVLTALKVHKEVIEEIDKLHKKFIWAGDKALTGGKCKVDWTKS